MKRSIIFGTVIALMVPSLITLTGAPALAGTITGLVVGKSNNPKPYVRVEILGPQSRTIFTDKDGIFSVNLMDGRYTINIIEGVRRMEFNDVSTGASATTFKLEW
jgi:hypothetical protein